MFRLRARVFRDKLNWKVDVDDDGMEYDLLDDDSAIYIVSEQAGAVVGCLRLLPTTGPTLLSGPFGEAFPKWVNLQSPSIWECSRFCTIDHDRARISAQLLAGVGEFCLVHKIQSVIGIFNNAMVRIYRRIGCQVDVLGSTDRYDEPVMVGLFPVNENILGKVRSKIPIAA